MIHNKSGFLEGRLLSSQSEQFEKFSKSSDWLEKNRLYMPLPWNICRYVLQFNLYRQWLN